MQHVSDAERRARLAVRHALTPGLRVASAEAATRAVTVLHSTEPATVYLSCWARTTSLTTADVDRALFTDRSLVKQLAMRRTLFVFPRELLPAVWPSASARVAGTERARMAKDVVKAGLATDGDDWLDRARAAVLTALAGEPGGRTALEIRKMVPELAIKVEVSAGASWTGSRVVTHLGLTGDLMRGENTALWHGSRPRWTLTRNWLGEVPPRVSAADGYRELIRRWLYSFGPGTENDIAWWLGSTKAVVRAALAELEAVPVTLDGGATGWLRPDDLGGPADPGPWAALLPVLDPTVMGWQGRDFFLGPHRDQLFDRNGNAGTTAWVNGRVAGCWVQDEGGAVQLRLLEQVSAAERALLDAEAARLTTWLDGTRVPMLYFSPAMKAGEIPAGQ